MNREQIIQLVRSHIKIVDFVKNNSSSIEFNIDGVPIIIFKEEVGTSFYYKIPFKQEYMYDNIVDFMRIAIPELSKLVENERDKKLYL